MLRESDIREAVLAEGFDLCGVTRAEHLVAEEEHFRGWRAAGYSEGLDYLGRYDDVRFDPRQLVDGARTVVVCGVNYKSEYSLGQSLDGGAAVASYALMRDYHKTIRKGLQRVMKRLKGSYPELEGRVFTDSAPILEKHLAVRSGLGWIGRQSLLVTPQHGTFVLLGELVLNLEAESYCEERMESRCGECRRCVEVCPSGAINDDRTIDTRRCIAARTIEHADAGDEPLGGWIFGCDVCQRVCPYNRLTPLATEPNVQPRVTPPSGEEWLKMDGAEFEQLAQGTPLKRSSLERIQSNVRRNCKTQK